MGMYVAHTLPLDLYRALLTYEIVACLQVHPADRVIVLDASAILSSNMITALLSPDRPQPAVGSAAAAAVRAAAGRAGSSSSIPVEGVAALLGLQIIVFLLAVCNVVRDMALFQHAGTTHSAVIVMGTCRVNNNVAVISVDLATPPPELCCVSFKTVGFTSLLMRASLSSA